MNGKSKLSVLLSNYNHAEFLPVNLESVLNQTFPPDEFIIFDDASTDESPKILQEYARRYPVIKLTLFKKNHGAIEMMSKLAEAATCEFVHFIGADDFIKEEFYEKSIFLLEQYPDAAYSSCAARLVDKRGNDLGFIQLPVVSRKPRYFFPHEVREKLKRYGPWHLGSAAVYRRTAIESINHFRGFHNLRSFQDSFSGNLLALKNGCIFIPEAWSFVRRAGDNYSIKLAGNKHEYNELINTFKSLMLDKYRGLFPREFVYDLERCFWGICLVDLVDPGAPEQLNDLTSILKGKSLFFKTLSAMLKAGILKGRYFLKLLVLLSYERPLLATIYMKIWTWVFFKYLKLKESGT